MDRPIQHIVIVGGGTAGWLTAGVIAARHKARMASGFKVTLVESPNVAIIGVGEGTWPTMRTTLEKMGVSETEFFRHCDTAFKQGGKFVGWTTGAADDAYYHPLMLPHGWSQVNLVPHWLQDGRGRTFSAAVCPQETICEEGLAPKTIATPEYRGLANYAYHLDAGKFASFMQKHCTEKLGVRHVLADVTQVKQDEAGDITGLVTEQAGEITGDMFVDCTGFRALLIGKTLGVGFKECRDVLFCDTALAVQVPHESEDAPMASQTIATAQSSGWIWDIALPTRRGLGYVYSSDHIDEEAARAELARYAGTKAEARKIPIRSGHREMFWKNNCVAVGLAAGFLEPLEASAIMLIELSAKIIADQLPARRSVMDVVARRFNEVTHYRWGRIIDFLKLHYVLTQRTDTAFWRDNVDPASTPERLRDLLRLWKYRAPWFLDEFDRLEEVFPAASYQYVLYGMGFRTEVDPAENSADALLASRIMEENAAMAQKMRANLPKNRDLVRKIRDHGMQSI
ncbi:tryptophan halogenase family protein [Nitrospirillum sp. BR 11164]|uniref:tryptophan halogenase family protein n=1 Tax=Nitrospirillum sp. BR 11164 TaxID=3104324 RepID=UPI002AFFDBB6|nr:tryptophan halogenase family protein [Nitrospirillum sp. BR 11164]MEA1648722.1 tryptophan halogenase family protein [Nitrospirillum sp. BR 11164]